jgi:hypothetical protein
MYRDTGASFAVTPMGSPGNGKPRRARQGTLFYCGKAMPKFRVIEPEEIARARQLYEGTSLPVHDIARSLGIGTTTLMKRVKLWGWTPRNKRLAELDAAAKAEVPLEVFRMGKNEKSGTRTGKIASQGLRRPSSLTTKQIKTLAASALTQRPDHKKPPGRK